MANELKHGSVGTELSQAEFEAVGLHVFDSQATGDVVYASSSTQLSRLGKGADNTFFQMGGSNIPEWVQDVTFQGASGSAMIQYWFGDAGEDNADKWRVSVADGGTLTYDSFISGSYVTHMTVAPHSTVASSVTTIHGTLTMGSTATLTNAGLLAVANQSNITGLGTITSGTWQGTVIGHAYLPAASTSAQGVVELAIASEVTTGTDTGRAITPDALAGSVVMGTRYVQCVVFDFGTDIAEGNGKFYFHIPAGLNGMNLVEVHSEVITAGNGSTIDVQIHNANDGSDMLSTSLTIDNTETGSDTASTSAVINTSEDDVATNDLIRIDVDGNGGDTTIAKGLIVTLGFRLP